MSAPGAKDAVIAIPLAPKLQGRSAPHDRLEQAGHLILDMLQQAAGHAQASHQQAVESSRKLSAQLRGAEDRIRELEATVRHHADRADRAEKWLHHVAAEIEEKFFGQDKAASR